MDTNSSLTALTPEYREKIYKMLAQTMLDGLDSGKIRVDESVDMSEFIIERLDNLQTQDDLYIFLDELSEKWSIYHNIQNQLDSEQQQIDKIEDVRNDLGNLTTA